MRFLLVVSLLFTLAVPAPVFGADSRPQPSYGGGGGHGGELAALCMVLVAGALACGFGGCFSKPAPPPKVAKPNPRVVALEKARADEEESKLIAAKVKRLPELQVKKAAHWKAAKTFDEYLSAIADDLEIPADLKDRWRETASHFLTQEGYDPKTYCPHLQSTADKLVIAAIRLSVVGTAARAERNDAIHWATRTALVKWLVPLGVLFGGHDGYLAMEDLHAHCAELTGVGIVDAAKLTLKWELYKQQVKIVLAADRQIPNWPQMPGRPSWLGGGPPKEAPKQ